DAFAHRTAEASIAEQLGDVLTANGSPRPTAADDDRIGGWQLMYQLLENDAWLITDHCAKLIECLPQLVRDDKRVEDIRKVDGDDAADAARYGLVSGSRLAGLSQPVIPTGEATMFSSPSSGLCSMNLSSIDPPGARFIHGMPLSEQIKRQITTTDPTSVAIHSQRLESEARRHFRPARLPTRRQ